MPFASALSQHPVASEAIGDAAGSVLEQLGERPDLVVLTLTRHHAGALEDIAATVEAALHPRATVGCAAASVVGTGSEDDTPAISLWAGRVGPVLEVAVDAQRLADDSWRFRGWPLAVDFEPRALLLFGDPFTFPTAEFLRRVEESRPGLPVIGGQASSGRGPGGTRLLCGRRVTAAGATGVLVGQGVEVEAFVCQGCRPFGPTLTVTRAEGNVVYELAGRPALAALVEQSRGALEPNEITRLASDGLYLGRLVDERIAEPGAEDLLVRPIVGVDRGFGALALDDGVPLGCTVRFCRRDPRPAVAELVALLRGRTAAGALAFVGAGRVDEEGGTARLAEALGRLPVGGMVSAGEIGPVGGTSFLLSHATALALVADRDG